MQEGKQWPKNSEERVLSEYCGSPTKREANLCGWQCFTGSCSGHSEPYHPMDIVVRCDILFFLDAQSQGWTWVGKAC